MKYAKSKGYSPKATAAAIARNAKAGKAHRQRAAAAIRSLKGKR